MIPFVAYYLHKKVKQLGGVHDGIIMFKMWRKVLLFFCLFLSLV